MAQFAPYIIEAIAVAGAGVSAYSSISAGNAANDQAKKASAQEADAARGREIERRRQLVAALSSQNAAAGAAGVKPNAAIAGADIAYERQDSLFDTVNTGRSQDILRSRGRNAMTGGYLKASSSLLGSASDIYGAFGGGTPAPSSSGAGYGGRVLG